MIERIDLKNFSRRDDLLPDMNLILTVKSFDLGGIRKRYLASRKNVSGRTGSVERRDVGMGGIVSLQIRSGKISDLKILCRMREPRGIDWRKDQLAIAAENEIFIFKDQQLTHLTNPWFSYIHTVQFSRQDPSKILISSSGLDLVFEYDWIKKSPTFEWSAWEHGFDLARDPV